MCTDDYGQQRTETDNTDDRPAGVQNKPYLHKPRKRRYPQTTIRLLGDSPTPGATASGLRSGALSRRYPRVLQTQPPSGENPNYLSPAGLQPGDRRNSQQASIRGVIAPLSASFASEAPGERTLVRDPGTERRKARGSKRERPVFTTVPGPCTCGRFACFRPVQHR